MWVLALWTGCAAETVPVGASAETGAGCPMVPGDGLSFARGCAGAFCAGTPFAEARVQLGSPDVCTGERASGVACSWGPMTVAFPDCGADGRPDTEGRCDLDSQAVTLTTGFEGKDDVHGLGIGVDAACFEAALGPWPETGQGWGFGFDPSVWLRIDPAEGPVESVVLDWQLDD